MRRQGIWLRYSASAALWAVLLGCGGAGIRGGKLPGQCEEPHAPTPGEFPDLKRVTPGANGTLLVEQLDLDGDRTGDRLISTSDRCDRNQNCAYSVYVMRGTCGHRLGTVWAAKARVQVGKESSRFRDLIAVTHGPDGEFEEWYRVTAKGGLECIAYREKKTYEDGRRSPLADWGAWESCESADAL